MNSLSAGASGRGESEPRTQDFSQHVLRGVSKTEEKSVPGDGQPDLNVSRGLIDSMTGSNRSARSRTEKEPAGRSKTTNRVAIFRDREVDRKDPDYDRSYDRYIFILHFCLQLYSFLPLVMDFPCRVCCWKL